MKATGTFPARAEGALKDAQLQEALARATTRFMGLRKTAFTDLPDGEALRDRAAAAKAEVTRHLDRYLDRFVTAARAAGCTLHAAADAAEARQIILEIARTRRVRRIVKSKSMATEEIHLNPALEAAGMTVTETDLGEWIIQLAKETPSHIIAPAIHKTRGQVADLFAAASGGPVPESIEGMVGLARSLLREAFLTADMGISGVNMAVAETGSIAIVTNEGNGRLVTSLPRIHVAVMGIEKLVPTLEDFITILKVLPRSATGQKVSCYVSVLTGPARPGEEDGPEELHLVLLDNGRGGALGTAFEESLSCLRCGACLNVCPVYRQIGGHAYGSVYGGPIGIAITPMLTPGPEAHAIAAGSTLCGACQDVCPVRIDIPRMILHRRAEAVEHRAAPAGERLAFRILALILRHPTLYRLTAAAGRFLQRPFLRDGRIPRLPGPLAAWTASRDFPSLASRPFQARWRRGEVAKSK